VCFGAVVEATKAQISRMAVVQIEHADLSLIGDRDENQDRVATVVGEQSVFAIVVDGMGGHSDGSRAAETAIKSLLAAFGAVEQPLFDPLGFLHRALSRAHDHVVQAGSGLPIEARPRATIALCLLQDGAAYWAHVGDSRIYHIRQGRVVERTRDHSHVELLLREGKITEAEMHLHPMRNFVECCLGGEPAVPEMTLSGRKPLLAGDIILLCTDGVWAGMTDSSIAAFYPVTGDFEEASGLAAALAKLGKRAVAASAPYSDNSTAAALRYIGD